MGRFLRVVKAENYWFSDAVCCGLCVVVVVPLLSHVQLFATPWVTACQAPLFSTISQNSCLLLEFMSIESLMLSNHLILCHPLLLLPSIFPSIRVFSSESVLCIRWPKYWHFSFSISLANEYSGLISFGLIALISLKSKGSLWPNGNRLLCDNKCRQRSLTTLFHLTAILGGELLSVTEWGTKAPWGLREGGSK